MKRLASTPRKTPGCSNATSPDRQASQSSRLVGYAYDRRRPEVAILDAAPGALVDVVLTSKGAYSKPDIILPRDDIRLKPLVFASGRLPIDNASGKLSRNRIIIC